VTLVLAPSSVARSARFRRLARFSSSSGPAWTRPAARRRAPGDPTRGVARRAVARAAGGLGLPVAPRLHAGGGAGGVVDDAPVAARL